MDSDNGDDDRDDTLPPQKDHEAVWTAAHQYAELVASAVLSFPGNVLAMVKNMASALPPDVLRSMLGSGITSLPTGWSAVASELLEADKAYKSALAELLAELPSRARRNVAAAERLGGWGWTLNTQMTFREIDYLTESESEEVFQERLQQFYGNDPALEVMQGRILTDPRTKPFHTVLRQCFAAFRREEYAMLQPSMIAIVEGVVRRHFTEEHFATRRYPQRLYEHADTIAHTDADVYDTMIWTSIVSFTKWFYAQHDDPAVIGTGRLNRHRIQHGLDAPPDDRMECLRLFHSLDTVTVLCT